MHKIPYERFLSLPPLLTTFSAAKHLGVTHAAVWQWIAKHHLTAVSDETCSKWIIRAEDLIQFCNATGKIRPPRNVDTGPMLKSIQKKAKIRNGSRYFLH